MDVQLRTLDEKDATVMAHLANNKNVWDNLRDKMPHPYTRKDAAYFIRLTQNENPQVTFGIACEGSLCGVIGLLLQSDVYRKSAEMGYWVGEPYWGKGIATQAVEKIVKYGFEKLGLHRIYAGVFENNRKSMHVLGKNGFTKEGVLRKAVLKNGVFYDEHRYSKLSEEDK